jgi:hypothetical protein
VTRFFENSTIVGLFLSSQNRIETPSQNLIILPIRGGFCEEKFSWSGKFLWSGKFPSEIVTWLAVITAIESNNVYYIIRVKLELKRVYINGCRYNERLNVETEGSNTPRIHWVALVNIQ